MTSSSANGSAAISRRISERFAGDWIDEILKKQFFADNIDEDAVKSAWKEIAGDFIGAHTEPISAKEGHIVLRVTQPAVRFRFFSKRSLVFLWNIKARFGAGKIKSIKFNLG